MLLWQHCHKKHLILGIEGTPQIHSPSKLSLHIPSASNLANLYASFISKFPLGEEDHVMRSYLWAKKETGVAFISNINLSRNTKEQAYQFRPEKLTTSFSIISSSPLLRGPVIKFRRGLLSNHLSNQRDNWLFLPTIHFVPFQKTNSPLRMAAQVEEHDPFILLRLDTLLGDRYF